MTNATKDIIVMIYLIFVQYVRVEYIKCMHWYDRLPPNGHGQGHVTRFFNFGLLIIPLELVKL